MLEFNEDNNFIIINEKAFVPGKGKGPFTKPFRASGSQIRLFRRLGLQVTIVDENFNFEKDSSNEEQTTPEDIKEEVNNDTKELEKETKENIEKEVEAEESVKEDSDDVEEETSEEKTLDEKVEDAEEDKETLTEEELKEFTVAELKKELDNLGVEYAKNARKQELIDTLLEQTK